MTDFTPDWISPPGDTIADCLEERGWKPEDLAQATGLPLGHIMTLLSSHTPITKDTAQRLSQVLGSSPEFWLVREEKYQKALKAG